MIGVEDFKKNSERMWQLCYQHPFVQEIGKGTLKREKFQFFLIQDYKFLLEYIKVLSMKISQIEDKDMLYDLMEIQRRTFEGITVHRQYLIEFGIPEDRIEFIKTGIYNEAYISALRNLAETKGIVEFLVAILPCPWSYHDFASELAKQYGEYLEGNPYKKWVKNYMEKNSYVYIQKKLEYYMRTKNYVKTYILQDLFQRSMEYEYLFWDMCYRETYSI